MRTVWVLATIALGLIPAVARQVPDVRTPPAGGGFEAQHRKMLWVTYRSFNRELERTGQFGAMGITNRCFFAANTINSAGNPYCEYPHVGRLLPRSSRA